MGERLDLILERDAEQAAISMMSQGAAAGTGSLALVTGPSGIGKTTLLGVGTESGDTGLRVLSARGMPLERDFSFGIVRQLFEPAGGGSPMAGRDILRDGTARDPYLTTRDLYGLTANLATREPVLIVVDDLHWADDPSLRWLSYLAARIEDLPAALLLAMRSGPGQPKLADELTDMPSCTVLAPRPLSAEASAALVQARLYDAGLHAAEPEDELGAACHARTGGNPFLLHALLDALGEAGERGETVTVAAVSAAAPKPVATALLRQIRPLEPEAEALIRAVAVLGGPAPLRHAATLADLELPAAARLADSLRSADILAPARDDAKYGEPLEFAHAIAEAAIYESFPSGERAIVHGRAAALLGRDGADAEQVARHLLRSEPAADPDVVVRLCAAATAASTRGAPEAVAGYLRRALAEPPEAEAKPGILLELGLALAGNHDPGAVGVLEDAVARATPADMPEAALRSAGVLSIRGYHDSALRICRRTLTTLDALPASDAGSGDPAARDSLEAAVCSLSWMTAETAADAWAMVRARTRESRARQSRGGQSSVGQSSVGPVWRVHEALEATITGAGRKTALARLRLGGSHSSELAARDTPVVTMALVVLLFNDEFAAATRLAEEVMAAARERESLTMLADVSWIRSAVLLRLGQLRQAVEVARHGLEIRLKNSPPVAAAWPAAHIIEALVGLGRLDEADDVADTITALQLPEGWIQTAMFTQARGALEVARHQYDEGLGNLLAAAEAWRALGVTSPALASWRTAAITAYASTGHEDKAAALAEEQLALARAADTRLTLGIALRAAAPYADDRVATLKNAVSALRDVHADYETAQALAQLGARLRQAGDRPGAQRHLRRALDLADRCGAQPLSDYARRELVTAGARPRRAALTGREALTGAERQVAALAAEGLSNRQIGQRLFITRATVETHLRHAFHKLGISSRRDLPGDL